MSSILRLARNGRTTTLLFQEALHQTADHGRHREPVYGAPLPQRGVLLAGQPDRHDLVLTAAGPRLDVLQAGRRQGGHLLDQVALHAGEGRPAERPVQYPQHDLVAVLLRQPVDGFQQDPGGVALGHGDLPRYLEAISLTIPRGSAPTTRRRAVRKWTPAPVPVNGADRAARPGRGRPRSPRRRPAPWTAGGRSRSWSGRGSPRRACAGGVPRWPGRPRWSPRPARADPGRRRRPGPAPPTAAPPPTAPRRARRPGWPGRPADRRASRPDPARRRPGRGRRR